MVVLLVGSVDVLVDVDVDVLTDGAGWQPSVKERAREAVVARIRRAKFIVLRLLQESLWDGWLIYIQPS